MTAHAKLSPQNSSMRFAVGTFIAIAFMGLLIGSNGLLAEASLSEVPKEMKKFAYEKEEERIVRAHAADAGRNISYYYVGEDLSQINDIASDENGGRRMTINILRGDAVSVEPDGTVKQYNVLMSSKPFETVPTGYEYLTDWPASESVMTYAIGRLEWHSNANGLVRLYDDRSNLIQEFQDRNTL
jgi:hypothetical protein